MTIKTNTFGRVELSGKEAERFVQHMDEDKLNPLAMLERGREVFNKAKRGETFTLKHNV